MDFQKRQKLLALIVNLQNNYDFEDALKTCLPDARIVKGLSMTYGKQSVLDNRFAAKLLIELIDSLDSNNVAISKLNDELVALHKELQELRLPWYKRLIRKLKEHGSKGT